MKKLPRTLAGGVIFLSCATAAAAQEVTVSSFRILQTVRCSGAQTGASVGVVRIPEGSADVEIWQVRPSAQLAKLCVCTATTCTDPTAELTARLTRQSSAAVYQYASDLIDALHGDGLLQGYLGDRSQNYFRLIWESVGLDGKPLVYQLVSHGYGVPEHPGRLGGSESRPWTPDAKSPGRLPRNQLVDILISRVPETRLTTQYTTTVTADPVLAQIPAAVEKIPLAAIMGFPGVIDATVPSPDAMFVAFDGGTPPLRAADDKTIIAEYLNRENEKNRRPPVAAADLQTISFAIYHADLPEDRADIAIKDYLITRVTRGPERILVGESKMINAPLSRWSFSLGTSGIVNVPEVGSDVRAKMDDGKLAADPLPRLLTMVTANWHPIPFNASRVSPDWGERVRLFAGMVMTPDVGLTAGLGVGLVRGLSLNVGPALLLTQVPRNHRDLGQEPPAERRADPLRTKPVVSWVVAGFSFGLK